MHYTELKSVELNGNMLIQLVLPSCNDTNTHLFSAHLDMLPALLVCRRVTDADIEQHLIFVLYSSVTFLGIHACQVAINTIFCSFLL
ncbi:hypothetical protein GDO86_001951 [Hymenochirus boettgeri]|uniref:Uncharacterized protein n=1 Tax=Hymenochirus boettgeri TaxID=247094 RepID=A0A8T2KET8_9PIPI|nr:hypothetical protein GDO86_001951 [Hymenochirus boettgeri]